MMFHGALRKIRARPIRAKRVSFPSRQARDSGTAT
jgi:hypothetical protein